LQFETFRLTTALLDKAAIPSNVVLVVAGPLVSEKEPVQVPLTASVFVKPLAANLECPARKSNVLIDATGLLAPPPPPPPHAVKRSDIARAKSLKARIVFLWMIFRYFSY
jgi:hypothetical protein